VSPIRATLWDLGGVVFTSPFDAFARYERERGLPEGFIRRLNARDPDRNAWARLERGEIDLDEFVGQFEAEARAAGGDLDGWEVLRLLRGDVRPEMAEAVRRCRDAGFKVGALTNNFVGLDDAAARGRPEVLGLFDVVVESAKVGLRKPDPRIYELACDLLCVKPPEVVFLDDLGINLKPARALGMVTIKVTDPEEALAELEAVLALPLRSTGRWSGGARGARGAS